MKFKEGWSLFLSILVAVVSFQLPSPVSSICWGIEYPSPAEDGTTTCISNPLGPAQAPPTPSASNPIAPPRFFLYTTANPDDGLELKADELALAFASLRQQINTKLPGFSTAKFAKLPLKILIHGFLSGPQNPFPKEMKDTYLHQKSTQAPNVILVDWSDIAGQSNYIWVSEQTSVVGEKTAGLIDQLRSEGLTSLDKVHLIGHSLGAHTSGFAGAAVAKRGHGKVSRITGMDPAGPNFCVVPEGRLDPSDAEFVDVIHTDDGDYCGNLVSSFMELASGKLGHAGTLGHIDFYPNGGAIQPGCLVLSACNHSRAHRLMQTSIEYPLQYVGRECPTFKMYMKGGCDRSAKVVMGEYTPHTARGTYYLRTN